MKSMETEGWSMLVLLGCFVVVVTFISLAFGAMNLFEPVTNPEPQTPPQVPPKQNDTEVARGRETTTWLRNLNRTLEEKLKEQRANVARLHEGLPGPAEDDLSANQQVDALRAKIDERRQRIDALRMQIEEAKFVPVAKLYGKASGFGKEPQWVECVEKAILLQPQGRRIALEELDKSPETFLKVVRQFGYVVFLVRSNGFESFVKARRLTEKQEGVQVGYEPIDIAWGLKF
jgi:hypothetical protein